MYKKRSKRLSGIVQIPVEEVRQGMYINSLDRPWEKSPFLVKGFLLTSPKQLETIRQTCEYVYVDTKRSKNHKTSEIEDIKSNGLVSPSGRREHSLSNFNDELDEASPVLEELHQSLVETFQCLEHDRPIPLEKLNCLIDDCLASIKKNQAAFLLLSKIQTSKTYLIDHSIRVAILAIMLGDADGMNQDELKSLFLSALLHDIGMLKLPEETINKSGPLTAAERKLVNSHPTVAKNLLEKYQGIPENVIEAIYCHHERLDGEGYPQSLGPYVIPYMAKVIAIVDSYDALTSERSYRESSSTLDAFRSLMSLRGSHYDERLLIKFVRSIRVYPAGSIAELKDGTVGIVLPASYENRLSPPILLTSKDTDTGAEDKILDLSLSENQSLRIVRIHPDGSFGIQAANYCLNHANKPSN